MQRALSPLCRRARADAVLNKLADLRGASKELQRHARQLAALAALARAQAAALLHPRRD